MFSVWCMCQIGAISRRLNKVCLGESGVDGARCPPGGAPGAPGRTQKSGEDGEAKTMYKTDGQTERQRGRLPERQTARYRQSDSQKIYIQKDTWTGS